ncbi:MAG: hypothetical protein JWM90_1979 [Thermoleophilia bacterium]|nr:hypothetical protein [Thermoleophilia bacterium]
MRIEQPPQIVSAMPQKMALGTDWFDHAAMTGIVAAPAVAMITAGSIAERTADSALSAGAKSLRGLKAGGIALGATAAAATGLAYLNADKLDRQHSPLSLGMGAAGLGAGLVLGMKGAERAIAGIPKLQGGGLFSAGSLIKMGASLALGTGLATMASNWFQDIGKIDPKLAGTGRGISYDTNVPETVGKAYEAAKQVSENVQERAADQDWGKLAGTGDWSRAETSSDS